MDGNSSKEGLAKKGQSDANDTTNLRKIKEEIIEDEDDQVVEEFFVNPELVEEVSQRHFLFQNSFYMFSSLSFLGKRASKEKR